MRLLKQADEMHAIYMSFNAPKEMRVNCIRLIWCFFLLAVDVCVAKAVWYIGVSVKLYFSQWSYCRPPSVVMERSLDYPWQNQRARSYPTF